MNGSLEHYIIHIYLLLLSYDYLAIHKAEKFTLVYYVGEKFHVTHSGVE